MLWMNHRIGKVFHSQTLKSLDHSQVSSNEAMLIVAAVLRKMSLEDRQQEDDRHSRVVVRHGEKTTMHSMKKACCKCLLGPCFTSQDTWWSERHSSGQTVLGSLNVWFTWSKTIIYLMGVGRWWCMKRAPSIAAEGLTFMRCAKKPVVLEETLLVLS